MRIAAALVTLLALGWAFTRATGPAELLLALGVAYLATWLAVAARSTVSRREWVKRFILVHVAAGLTVAILELPALAGLLDYRTLLRTPILSPARNPRYRIDPELLFIRQPHDRQQGVAHGGTMSFLYEVGNPTTIRYELRYDRDGFRNDGDLDPIDLAVIGDSFVEGAEVAAESTATAVLGRLTGLTALNLGQIQYGPRQELVVLTRYALPRRPEAVVWLFFEGNDLDDLQEYDAAVADLDRFVAARHGFVSRSFTRNALLVLTRLLGNPRPSGMTRAGIHARGNGDGRDTLYFLYEGRASDAAQQAALDATVAVLAEADRLTRAAGARLLVGFVPTKYRVYHDLLTVPKGSALRTWEVNDLPARLGARLAASGIDFLDLTDALRNAVRSGDRPYYADDSHWSATGHRIAAEAIARRLTPDGPG